jgi:hypothetical protein
MKTMKVGSANNLEGFMVSSNEPNIAAVCCVASAATLLLSSYKMQRTKLSENRNKSVKYLPDPASPTLTHPHANSLMM